MESLGKFPRPFRQDKYTSESKKINPTSEKNPENSSGDLKLSMPGDRGDTSLDPIDYRRSIDPLFDFFMEYSDNGILNPGKAHIGEDFSGKFVSPEFVAYSVKRKQGKNESDANYRKFQAGNHYEFLPQTREEDFLHIHFLRGC